MKTKSLLPKLFVAFLIAGFAPGTVLHAQHDGPPHGGPGQFGPFGPPPGGHDGGFGISGTDGGFIDLNGTDGGWIGAPGPDGGGIYTSGTDGDNGPGGDNGPDHRGGGCCEFGHHHDFGLHPTADAPAGAFGEAHLASTGTDGIPTALDVDVTGLADGTYTVSTTSLATTGSSTIIGTFVVDSATATTPDTEASLALPDGFDPKDIANVQILDANNVVLLTGNGECRGGPVKGLERLEQHVILTPTADAPAGAKGRAEIEAVNKSGTSAALLQVETEGLDSGTYTVSVTALSTGSSTVLGTLVTSGSGSAGLDCGSETGLAFPDGFNPLDIGTVQVADSNAMVLLIGDFSAVTPASFSANIATTPGAAAPDSTGKAIITERTGRHNALHQSFSLVASKLPASTTLTVQVNGVTASSVKTSRKGHVTLHKLPKGQLAHKITSVTLINAAGAVALGAHF